MFLVDDKPTYTTIFRRIYKNNVAIETKVIDNYVKWGIITANI